MRNCRGKEGEKVVGGRQGLGGVMGGGVGGVGGAQKGSKCKKCEVYKCHYGNSPEPSKS